MIPSVNGCYEERLIATKHNGFNMPRGAMNVGYYYKTPGVTSSNKQVKARG